jgi:hypothetical protein
VRIALAACVAMSSVGAPPLSAFAVRSSLVQALEAYGDGTPARLEFLTIEDLHRELRAAGPAWVTAGPAADRSRRKNVVALLALDAVLKSPVPARVKLLEWACDYLRSGEPTEFEHTWMLVSIAFAQTEHLETFLVEESCPTTSRDVPCHHVRHAISRFPADRRFAAGNLFGRAEVNVVTRRPVSSPSVLTSARGIINLYPPAVASAQDANRIADTFSRLEALMGDPVVGHTARLRIGILQYELARFEDSRRTLTGLLADTRDPYDTYFAHLILGLGFDAEGRSADASKSFASALQLDPEIVSGATALAAHYVATGRSAEGSALVDRALAADPAHNDPWQHPCPYCGAWTAAIEQLHRWVRR